MQKKDSFNFPLVFEVIIWIFYVSLYKYSYLVDHAGLPRIRTAVFPYPEIALYAILSTLYLVPYYRWLVPKMLYLKYYVILFLATIIVFVLLAPYNNIAISSLFYQFNSNSLVSSFFEKESAGFFLDLNLIMTDLIAFLSIAFARFSYQKELERHRLESDHLNLKLSILKNQLQPHFLFNNLNSLYGISLKNSKETPRFILLLSNMMQYILYECDQPMVSLSGELSFMHDYFELEQKKYPDALISFNVIKNSQEFQILPMLILPLIENSFKHGKHKVDNDSSVVAELSIDNDKLEFWIKNDKLSKSWLRNEIVHGGIGLVNIKKRLALYYPGRHELLLTDEEEFYVAKLTIEI